MSAFLPARSAPVQEVRPHTTCPGNFCTSQWGDVAGPRGLPMQRWWSWVLKHQQFRGERKGVRGRQESMNEQGTWVFFSQSSLWGPHDLRPSDCKNTYGGLFPTLYIQMWSDGQNYHLKFFIQPLVPAAYYPVELNHRRKWIPCQTSHQRASIFVQPVKISFHVQFSKKTDVNVLSIKR